MTTTEPTTERTTLPTWLNLDAIHPPETLTELPALIDAARGVLEAVVAYNRQYVGQMHAYYDRSHYDDGLAELVELVDEHTGMSQADDYLLLAGTIIEYTVVGQGTATESYAKELMQRYPDLVEGARGMYSSIAGGPLPAIDAEVQD